MTTIPQTIDLCTLSFTLDKRRADQNKFTTLIPKKRKAFDMKLKRILAAVLALMTLLLAACNSNQNEDTDTAEPAVTIGASELSEYTVVVSEYVSDEEKAAVTDLVKKIYEKFGTMLKIVDDAISKSDKEILVGEVNREVTKSATADMKYDDYFLGIADGKLVVAGGSESATAAAIQKLCEVVDANADSDIFFDNGVDMQNYKHSYTHEDIKINGTSVSEYTIMYADKGSRREATMAQTLQKAIISVCGVEVTAQPDTKDAYGSIIYLGGSATAATLRIDGDVIYVTGANENDFTAKIYMKDESGNISLVWDSANYSDNYDGSDPRNYTMEQAPYFGVYMYADVEGLVLSEVCAVYENADGSLVQGEVYANGPSASFTVMEQPESVTVNVVAKDGSVIDTQACDFGDKYTLPTSNAAYFLGWNDGKALYNANDAIPMYNDVTVTETTFEFKTMVGAGIRVADPSGIRFGTLVNKADYDNLVALGIAVATGTLITPTDYLADENVFEGESSLKEGKTLKNIVNDGFAKTIVENGVEYYVYYGSLVNLQNHNYARAFSGTSYATLTIAGEETTIYGGYTKENQSRSIYQVAKAVLADDTLAENGTQKTAAKGYINSVVMATVEGTTVTMDANGSTAYEVTVAGTTVTVTAKNGGDLSNVKTIVLNGKIYKEFNVANGAITLTLSANA